MACQVVHYPEHSQVVTELAPEPRDVVWSKISMSSREGQIRDVVIIGFMTILLLTWIGRFPSAFYEFSLSFTNPPYL